MATTTPFVKRMRTQGGTIYTFSSALEDIGLNINERNNIVKMSHYALLNIPDIGTSSDLEENNFNVFAIPGAYEAWHNSGNIKDARVMVAESFQNYALNLETNLLAQSTYNAALQDTVSERVFWKWLKETGAVRWEAIDTSAGLYWQEDTSAGYSSVVQAIGLISAGSVRTDTFGTYNETYILVPTSFGKTPVYFKQVEDDNYYHGLSITGGLTNILGRENYLRPHPDALDIQAYYDLADSSTVAGDYNLQYFNGTTDVSGWWWSLDGSPISNSNSYFIDASSYIIAEDYYIDLTYEGGVFGDIEFRRSKVDCISIEYDLTNLRTIFADSTLTFDTLATELAEDDEYDFNVVLIYYSVYNKSLDTILATNLLGVLFLDPPSGSTTSYPTPENNIIIPSITKLQSGPSGFGTSYSFRLNVKSDYMLDDTTATIVDESTSAQTALENFSQVFDSLEKTLAIMNQHTGTINYITSQYLDITSNQTGILNQITDLENRLNTMEQDISGTSGSLAMFTGSSDPLTDSSIYMKNGKIGFFTDDPTYPAQFDASVKVADLTIGDWVIDVSGATGTLANCLRFKYSGVEKAIITTDGSII